MILDDVNRVGNHEPNASPSVFAAKIVSLWRVTHLPTPDIHRGVDRLVAAIASGELDWETLHTCSAAADAKRRKARRAAALAASITPATAPASTPPVPRRVPAVAAA